MFAVKRAALAACALAAIVVTSLPATAIAGGGPAPVAAASGETLRVGGGAGGDLRQGDDQLDSGEFADHFRFTARRGERVSIELSSEQFDTYLILRRPDGEQQDNDDRGDIEGTNSRIETALPADGEYEVVVTSYRPGETGRYQLALNASTGTARQAAVQPGPRVFALLVGVSDYGGRTSDLANTDDDAKALSQQLERAGVLNPASVVLTNAEATRAGVREAFARIAQQAGPNDTFLFFFSGHGDHVAAQSASELDGQSETIELRDGAMTDVELAQLFGTLHTRLSILALDSCFSGGFDNVVSRPNVMGLFSSEEDLTSQVASNYGAGGYLSHFLQAGVGGEADIDGDRMLTAGELSAYLRRAFRAEGDIPASTGDGLENFQNLVIARGGVHLDDVIYRLDGRAPMQMADNRAETPEMPEGK
jgi:hypothetical protein